MCQFVCEYSNTVLFPEGESHTCSVFDCEDLTVMQVCLGKTAAEHSLNVMICCFSVLNMLRVSDLVEQNKQFEDITVMDIFCEVLLMLLLIPDESGREYWF